MVAEAFDAIIIGAGQAGGPLSTALGEAGWKTAIVEREHVGGTCVNVGCTPTKAMVASARIAHLVHRSASYGVMVEGASIDLATVRQRKRAIVEAFRGGSQRGIEAAQNVELIFGEARFVDSSSIDVDLRDGGVRTLRGNVIVINAGTRPRRLETPGLTEAGPLDSTSIMELERVPGHLAIVGGGPVGLEFGQMFRRFGSRVTIVERANRLLASEDPDVSHGIAAILAEDGIEVVFGGSLERVECDGDERVVVVSAGGQSRRISCDQILVAVGRTPNSDVLNLDAAGIETDERGHIRVNAALRTNVDDVYAVGDITGGPAFTHIAYDDFRKLRANLLHNAGASTAGRLLPYTIFIDPQLGRVGLSENQARDQGHDVIVFKLPMSSVARALEVDETRGFMKAVVDRSTGLVLGAAVLGLEGGEIAGAIQLAMMGGLPYTALRDGIFSHPTLIESLNNLFSSPVVE
jgi:pyruvate/2-oxoglutarate dehydrogenase complex dihydrolipoamide dehydrogenase (E3) component